MGSHKMKGTDYSVCGVEPLIIGNTHGISLIHHPYIKVGKIGPGSVSVMHHSCSFASRATQEGSWLIAALVLMTQALSHAVKLLNEEIRFPFIHYNCENLLWI